MGPLKWWPRGQLILMAYAVASLSVTCGGIIGNSGSTTASMTHGRSEASARSSIAGTSSFRSMRTPASPSDSAKTAYFRSGISCEPSNFGSPDCARISQVTMFRSRLFRTSRKKRGSFHSFQYLLTVISSFIPFICTAPSPASANTGRSG